MKQLSLAFAVVCIASIGFLPGQTYDPAGDMFIYRGDQVPEYYVVLHYFDRLLSSQGKQAYEKELKAIGVRKNSPLERELEDTAREVMNSRNNPGPKFAGNEAAYEAEQINHLRQQVTRVRSLLKRFRALMEAEGISPDMLKKHVNETARPEVTLYTLRHPLSEARLEILREFELTQEDGQ